MICLVVIGNGWEDSFECSVLKNTVVAAIGIDKLDTAELPFSCTLGSRWDVLMIRPDFKSEAIFGFLNPNYTGQILVFCKPLKWPRLTSRRVGCVFQGF